MGASRISPAHSLYVEANEPPPDDICRLKLTLQIIVKQKGNIDNTAFDCVFIHNFENLIAKNKKNCFWMIDESNILLDIAKTGNI